MKILDSGLVTKRNRTLLRKIDPRSIPGGHSVNVLPGQGLRGGGQEELLSQLPALLSRPVASPVEGLVDSHGQGGVVLSQPIQAAVEPASQPGQQEPGALGQPGAGGGLDSQVDPVGRNTVRINGGLRRSTRETKKIDRLGI